MNPQLLRAFDALRPTFKQTWERQLRASAATTVLALPELLVPMMDDTIDELRRVVVERHRGVPLEPLHAICRCGKNPLLRYFETGDLALLSIADRLAFAYTEVEFEDLRQAFYFIARRELDYFCRLCGQADAGVSCAKPETSRSPS